MDEYKGGLGILKATEISIELGLNNSGKEKTMLFDSILDHVQNNINASARKDPRVNAIEFSRNGKEEEVLIRTVSSGSTGYTLDSAWQGDAMFFERSDHGVEISGKKYKIVLVGAEEYLKLLDKYPKNKSSGTPDKDVTAQELDQDKFNDYFKRED
ncbi:MAG: hypothetical protein IJ746_00610 [Ruminococcus sp.]|nr:hypothetical protein [Ruminococcus sp.]